MNNQSESNMSVLCAVYAYNNKIISMSMECKMVWITAISVVAYAKYDIDDDVCVFAHSLS